MSELNKDDSQAADLDAKEAADIYMRKFRERITAYLALSIVVAAVLVLLLAAFTALNGTTEAFTNVKDILGFLNPLLGVILGYYFNKVSTEARAENAESTAKVAAASAQTAEKAREKAEDKTQQVTANAQEMRAHMSNLAQAVESMLSDASAVEPEAVTFATGPGHEDAHQHLAEVREALEMAKKFTM